MASLKLYVNSQFRVFSLSDVETFLFYSCYMDGKTVTTGINPAVNCIEYDQKTIQFLSFGPYKKQARFKKMEVC